MNNKEEEAKELLQHIKHIDIKKYSNDNDYFPGFPTLASARTIYSNYFIFKRTAESFKIYEKINDILKKYNDENGGINEEIDNIKKEYKKIMKEAEENADFYYRVILILYWDYQLNYWKSGVGKVFDKTTTGILSLLNKNYINYENKLINICNNLKEINLELTNSN